MTTEDTVATTPQDTAAETTVTSEQTTSEAPPTEQQIEQAQETQAPETQPTEEESTTESVSLKLPEGLPPQIGEVAKKLGYTQEQLDGTLQVVNGLTQAQQQAFQQQLAQQAQEHLEKWGDQKEQNLYLAKQALKEFDTDGKVAKLLAQSGYGNHPVIIDFLYRAGQALAEGGFIQGRPTPINKKVSPAEALYGKFHPVQGG